MFINIRLDRFIGDSLQTSYTGKPLGRGRIYTKVSGMVSYPAAQNGNADAICLGVPRFAATQVAVIKTITVCSECVRYMASLY